MQEPKWLEAGADGSLRLEVHVATRASRTRIMGAYDGRLKIQVAAIPEDGKANEALVRFVAERLEIPRAQLEIVGGATSRRKSLRILGVSIHRAVMRLTPGA